jgi:hypothetical protein
MAHHSEKKKRHGGFKSGKNIVCRDFFWAHDDIPRPLTPENIFRFGVPRSFPAFCVFGLKPEYIPVSIVISTFFPGMY